MSKTTSTSLLFAATLFIIIVVVLAAAAADHVTATKSRSNSKNKKGSSGEIDFNIEDLVNAEGVNGEYYSHSRQECEVQCPACGPTAPFYCKYQFWNKKLPDDLVARRCLNKLLQYENHNGMTTEALRTAIIRRVLTVSGSGNNFADGQTRVWLFAGDNGVGKTRMARIVSRVFSLSMSTEYPDGGDALLEINCGAMAGLGRVELRKKLVHLVEQHVKAHARPIIVLNDIHAIDNKTLFGVYGSLFDGRFVERPDVALHKATVIATMDMEHPGATMGLALDTLTVMVAERMERLFGSWVRQRVKVFPFVPFGDEEIVQALKWHLETMPCRDTHVKSIEYDELLIEALRNAVHRAPHPELNGRRVSDVFTEEAESKITEAINRELVKTDDQATGFFGSDVNTKTFGVKLFLNGRGEFAVKLF